MQVTITYRVWPGHRGLSHQDYQVATAYLLGTFTLMPCHYYTFIPLGKTIWLGTKGGVTGRTV